MISKNIPNFEICQQLKAAGYPQPTSEFGQFWYVEPKGRLCVNCNRDHKVQAGTRDDDRPILGYVYAPTVMEMAEYAKSDGRYQVKELFKLWADGEPTRQDIANDMARFVLWLIEWRKKKDDIKGAAARFCENMQSLNTSLTKEYHEFVKTVYIPGIGDAYQEGPHTHIKSDNGGFILSNTKVEDAVKLFESVKKFDEANPVPFYKTYEYKAKKEAQEKEKAEKERMHWQNMFEPGNVILVCFGRDGDNVQDMLVLGHDFGLEHVKPQNKDGVSFWKKRKHVFVKSILANINRPIDPSIEHLVRAFLPIETFFPTEKTGNIENEHLAPTGILKNITYAIAGEELKPGEIVFIAPDGNVMKADRPTNPTEPTSK